MATLWETITGNSSLPVQPGNNFWDHLNNQQGGGDIINIVEVAGIEVDVDMTPIEVFVEQDIIDIEVEETEEVIVNVIEDSTEVVVELDEIEVETWHVQ